MQEPQQILEQAKYALQQMQHHPAAVKPQLESVTQEMEEYIRSAEVVEALTVKNAYDMVQKACKTLENLSDIQAIQRAFGDAIFECDESIFSLQKQAGQKQAKQQDQSGQK
ncbi:MAG: hypothetical protein ACE3JP_15365 [Ectobacillus sp.]